MCDSVISFLSTPCSPSCLPQPCADAGPVGHAVPCYAMSMGAKSLHRSNTPLLQPAWLSHLSPTMAGCLALVSLLAQAAQYVPSAHSQGLSLPSTHWAALVHGLGQHNSSTMPCMESTRHCWQPSARRMLCIRRGTSRRYTFDEQAAAKQQRCALEAA